ncbi:MAG: hypothetical protein R3C14_32015 [Caldilineaceae bacterium]
MVNLNFLQFLQDEKGIFSSTRLAFLLWTIGVLVAWLTGSFHEMKLLPIDNSVIRIISAFMTGKVVQKYAEKSADESDESAPPAKDQPVQSGSNGKIPAPVPA